MPHAYSPHFHRTVNATDAPEVPLLLLEIAHPALLDPIRVVNDMVSCQHRNHLFFPLAFRATLPDDRQEGLPRALLSMDNVDSVIAGWLEATRGGQGATCRMMQILRSDPETIELDMTLHFTNIVVTAQEVRGELSYDDLLNKPAIGMIYSPENSPGLF